jgi:hypothetical protein
MVARASRPVSSKRRWGYLVWGMAGVVIAVPEITAAADGDALPFTTISGMVGHLERRWSWVELIVVAAIAFAFFSTVKVPPQPERAKARSLDGGDGDGGSSRKPGRTAGGRLTLQRPAGQSASDQFADDDAPLAFAIAALLSFALVAVATWAAVIWWDDSRHYQPAYVLYGLLGLLWLLIPGLLAFARGMDLPFPTLFRTVTNLEDWLSARSWPLSLGPLLGWLVAYVVVAGLVILLLHLTLYPYPDITHIINPNG